MENEIFNPAVSSSQKKRKTKVYNVIFQHGAFSAFFSSSQDSVQFYIC